MLIVDDGRRAPYQVIDSVVVCAGAPMGGASSTQVRPTPTSDRILNAQQRQALKRTGRLPDDLRMDAIDGDWCIVAYLGGNEQKPYIQAYWPSPGAQFHATPAPGTAAGGQGDNKAEDTSIAEHGKLGEVTPPAASMYTDELVFGAQAYCVTAFTGNTSACGGAKALDGTWFYIAGSQRLGCGRKFLLTNANPAAPAGYFRRQCVVQVADAGPARFVEENARKAMLVAGEIPADHPGVSVPVIDASPAVCLYLFGASATGVFDGLDSTSTPTRVNDPSRRPIVTIEALDDAAPLGIYTTATQPTTPDGLSPEQTPAGASPPTDPVPSNPRAEAPPAGTTFFASHAGLRCRVDSRGTLDISTEESGALLTGGPPGVDDTAGPEVPTTGGDVNLRLKPGRRIRISSGGQTLLLIGHDGSGPVLQLGHRGDKPWQRLVLGNRLLEFFNEFRADLLRKLQAIEKQFEDFYQNEYALHQHTTAWGPDSPPTNPAPNPTLATFQAQEPPAASPVTPGAAPPEPARTPPDKKTDDRTLGRMKSYRLLSRVARIPHPDARPVDPAAPARDDAED